MTYPIHSSLAANCITYISSSDSLYPVIVIMSSLLCHHTHHVIIHHTSSYSSSSSYTSSSYIIMSSYIMWGLQALIPEHEVQSRWRMPMNNRWRTKMTIVSPSSSSPSIGYRPHVVTVALHPPPPPHSNTAMMAAAAADTSLKGMYVCMHCQYCLSL